MNKLLLAFLALITLISPAQAALDGWDTVPGDACTAAEEGHTRRNASAGLDETEITLICDGTVWQSATGGGGLAALQGQDDAGPCTVEKDGLIKYNASGNPRWEYCHGGTTSWLPFRLPQCQNDGTGECTLSALRSSDDPQFKASSIRCGDNVLGVTGTYGSGSASSFNFTDVTNAALSTLTTASAVTISGIPAGCPGEVEVSGQGSPQISIAGGAWGTSGSIANGQTLAVRLTSSASFSTPHVATVSIGSTDSDWSVTTVAADTSPYAFMFTDQTNVALNTLTTSNSVTIDGINTSTPVSVTGGGSPQISINGGAWATSGNIMNGQSLQVRLTSSSSAGTNLTASVTVGTSTVDWDVTTVGPDTVPNAFSFTDQTGVELSTLITSNSITIAGINTSTPVSVSGGGSPQISIAGGAWGTSGNITNGQSLQVRLTSSASYVTANTATVNVGGVTDDWSVTTRPDVTPGSQTFSTAGSFNFTVPAHNTLTVEVWGGGGGGGGSSGFTDVNGTSGSSSNWDATALVANGGAGSSGNTGGVGGTGSGGTVNISGNNGSNAGTYGGAGGAGGNGGAGGAGSTGHGNPGVAPGGGGSGAYVGTRAGTNSTGGGGGGGYTARTYTAGTYAVGTSVNISVGNRGTGGVGTSRNGGNGAIGRVTITWN